MYLLDTNIFAFSVADLYGVNDTIRRTSNTHLYISTIVVIETLYDGRLKALTHLETNHPKSNRSIGSLMQLLKDTVEDLSEFNILQYPDEAETVFNSIFTKRVNGPDRNDWRMAAHAIHSNMTVVTDNTSDFERIREVDSRLRFVNWADRSI
jgi:predicted nucleic acid-binding protein